eukprot:10759525-Alexandrium_andersonii.AAC.1
MVEAARASPTSGKPEAPQSLNVKCPQRAGSARVPWRLRRSLAHIPGWETSGGRATYTSSST